MNTSFAAKVFLSDLQPRRLTVGAVVLLVACTFSLGVVARGVAEEWVIAENGRSDWIIVCPNDAIESERYAAEELARFIEKLSGAKLPVIDDTGTLPRKAFLLGRNAYLDNLGVSIDFAKLGHEGYVLQTQRRADGSEYVVIAGGRPRGTLYGVYGLLEDHLGCRWFTPDAEKIPRRDPLRLPAISETKIPLFEYREPFTYDCFDGDWCARNRVNSSAGRLTAKHGGKIRFGSGFFCHTFNRLVPPDQYFDSHPEYFSLVNGKRLKERTQLCCTNEDVIRLCTEGILRAIENDPEAFVFSVSQNDWHNYCTCDRCRALAESEESQMAPVLFLVNRVAEAVAQKYPDKAIETLAYQWTRKPPKTMRPRPNVIIRLCSIECCFAHPLAECDQEANRRFVEDLQGWAKICDRLWVWNYVTDFRHYLLPFPNLRVRNDNIRLFAANNVRGIFEQDTYNTPSSELAALNGYITAKFLWNPDYDEDTAINEFLDGYYGKAAPFIRRYIDAIHDRVAEENIHMTIWVPPTHPHLTDELLARADKLWQQAEDAVAADDVLLRRVQIGRMSVDYAILERARANPDAEPLASLARKRFEPFFDALAVSGLTRIREWNELNVSEYRDGLARALKLNE